MFWFVRAFVAVASLSATILASFLSDLRVSLVFCASSSFISTSLSSSLSSLGMVSSMVSCSFLSPFLPRLAFGLAEGPPLRLLPEAARSPAGLLWEELGLEL